VRERDDGELAGAVGSEIGVAGAARNRCRVDDLTFCASGDHRLGGLLNADHHPERIHIHDLLPDRFARFEERFRLIEACVVHHHFDRAKLACTRFDSGADRSPIRHVDALEDRPAFVCSGNLLGGCTAIRLVEIADND
jgi:hypothetical protein